MIVTCENCGARYKLPDTKISGRGAKITCPRCRHVFVVFREGPDPRPSLLDPGPGPTTFPPLAPTSVPPLAGPTATASVIAAPPRRDVHGLDFRKVGIQSWKVKVKIGLIYDFSDYKTLRKYIQDGRVTPSDLLSHDGKTWTPIGDIPDLEAHFVQIYEEWDRKRDEQESARAPVMSGFEDESPTSIVGMADLASTLADQLGSDVETAARVGGFGGASATVAPLPAARGPVGGPRSAAPGPLTPPPTERPANPEFVDPVEKAKAKQRRRMEARRAATRTDGAEPEGRSRLNPVIIGVVLLLVAAGAFIYLRRQAVATTTPSTPPPSVTAAPPSEGSGRPSPEDYRKSIQEELSRELEEVNRDGLNPITVPDEDQLIPVRPSSGGSSGSASGGSTARGSTPSSRGGESGTPVTLTAAPMTARDHAEAGDDAWRRGDWRAALSAYQQAAALEPTSATWQTRLGRAMYKTGDPSNAKVALSKAERSGVPEASKWLGHIARDQGDIAGAIGHYNTYLKSSPSDAGEIQREIDALTGS